MADTSDTRPVGKMRADIDGGTWHVVDGFGASVGDEARCGTLIEFTGMHDPRPVMREVALLARKDPKCATCFTDDVLALMSV